MNERKPGGMHGRGRPGSRCHVLDASPHPAHAGKWRVECHGAPTGRLTAQLPCGCKYPITKRAQHSKCRYLVFAPARRTGCTQCQPGAPAAAPAPPAAAASASGTAAPVDGPQPPAWWREDDDLLFAEVLYLHKQRQGDIDHYIFASVEASERFPNVSRAQWFAALEYIDARWRDGGSVMATHVKALRGKRARVAPVDPAAGADEGDEDPTTRRPRRQRTSTSGAAWGGIFAAGTSVLRLK